MNLAPVATEIELKRKDRIFAIKFEDGAQFDLSYELLRVHSPSAEVQGHSPDQRKTVGGKIDVAIASVAPVGNYAVRIGFDDGHDTGIFSWSYLAELFREKDTRWQAYLAELDAKGLRRER